ncbi:unnamed protein product [Alopecurus aequalis]
MDLSQAPPTTGDAPPMSEVVNVPVGIVSGQPTSGEVAAVISATMPMKRKRTPKIFFDTPAAAAAGSAATPMTPTAPAKGGRVKIKAAAGRGPPPKAKKAATPAAAVPPAPTPSSADAHEVLDEVPTPPVATSYMAMLNDSAVDLEAGIGAFDDDYADYAEDEEGDEEVDDDVVEVEAAAARRSKPGKQSNYTEIEDVTLVRAWGKVSMDACTGTDQTGKRYWQRIEDLYHKLKPRTKTMKELLAEEKEIMMMNTKDMDDDQLLWWNETKAEIMARKLQARQARAATDLGASTPQGESPMSGGADGGLLD